MEQKEYRILTINLGATSSSAYVYEGDRQLLAADVSHTVEELEARQDIHELAAFRRDLLLEAIEAGGIALSTIDGIAAGGIGKRGRYYGGAYEITAQTAADAANDPHRGLACGPLIAHALSEQYGIPAYLYDVFMVDEMQEVARVSGTPAIERSGETHTLNTRAAARAAAADLGRTYEDVTFIMCHLGGGISTSLHVRGKILDVTSTDEGTFTLDRSGRVPCEKLLNLCLSGNYTEKELRRLLRGDAGLIGYLGTNDCKEVEQRIADGDRKAELVYRAMAYQTAKDVGALAAAVCGKVDAIVLTGGIAWSQMFTGMIEEYVSFLAPVLRKPGSYEMKAMADGVARVLRGEEKAWPYRPGETILTGKVLPF
ncbi:MAG: butyrate kinase [Mogibacterium sp.]|nr:butyrate kinase [Mogibacterium sp.]